MLQRLLDDHARLRGHATGLVELVSSHGTIDPVELENLRWTLARESLQHLAADERLVLSKLEAEGSECDRAVAVEFRADLDTFNAAFKQHMEHWTGSRVRRSPARYAASVRELVIRLQDRLDREERLLYPRAAALETSQTPSPKRNWAGDAWTIQSSIAA